jgi:hypothetical protein
MVLTPPVETGQPSSERTAALDHVEPIRKFAPRPNRALTGGQETIVTLPRCSTEVALPSI